MWRCRNSRREEVPDEAANPENLAKRVGIGIKVELEFQSFLDKSGR